MKLIKLEQGSEEWHKFRLGKITGTRLGSIWSSRQYTKDDIVSLLTDRGVEFKKSWTKKALEDMLTDDDKEILSSDSEKKLEYYQILADQVAVDPAEEDDGKWATRTGYVRVMDRGTGNEKAAADMFAERFKKRIFEVGCCLSEDDNRVINSPDRLVVPKSYRGKDIDKLIDQINEGKHKVTEAVEVKCLASAKHLMAFFEKKVPEEYWTQKVQYFVTNEHLQTLYWVFYDPRIPMLPMFVLTINREDLGHWPETMLKYQLRTMRELDVLTERLFDESDQIIMPAKPEKGVEVS